MKTLIVDDHTLFSEGLRLLLMAAMPNAVVTCCDDGAEAIHLAQQTPFELILLDWNLGSGLAGLEVLQRIKSEAPQTRVVIVSGDCDTSLVRQAIEAGAVGFVPKESPSALLIDALTITGHGGIYLPVSVLVDTGSAAPPGLDGRYPTTSLRSIRELFPSLTPRHVDVLDLVVRGMSNKHIARALDITDGTVKQHLNAIYRELGIDNRTAAVYLLALRGVRFN